MRPTFTSLAKCWGHLHRMVRLVLPPNIGPCPQRYTAVRTIDCKTLQHHHHGVSLMMTMMMSVLKIR